MLKTPDLWRYPKLMQSELLLAFAIAESGTRQGCFESLAPQGFQNNPFLRVRTKKWGLYQVSKIENNL